MAVVLVVEDEDQVRVLAQSYLEEQGHEVLSADTPTGALAILEKSDGVDLLFTDLDLKGDIQAGIELAKAAVKLCPQLRVLYTTGRAITDGMKARFVPGSATLAKPYTVEELRGNLSTNFQIDPLRGVFEAKRPPFGISNLGGRVVRCSLQPDALGARG
ncbi:MAG TPA: response regulator [Xanthobacteraceae bacterium]|nr:response regulator [Xanthobacteraceae bacterium]